MLNIPVRYLCWSPWSCAHFCPAISAFTL